MAKMGLFLWKKPRIPARGFFTGAGGFGQQPVETCLRRKAGSPATELPNFSAGSSVLAGWCQNIVEMCAKILCQEPQHDAAVSLEKQVLATVAAIGFGIRQMPGVNYSLTSFAAGHMLILTLFLVLAATPGAS